MLLPVAEARAILSAIALDWGVETVALPQASTRVLAQKIVADRDQPPFNCVAMDGIAIDYAAYAKGQRRFPIAWLQAAGDVPRTLEDATKCVEIMTGAALPGGVTTVIRYEDLVREGNAFILPEGVVDAKSIHRQGKDIQAGMVLAEPGRQIGVAELGMLASCGYAEVSVVRKPKIAVIATGNELVPVADAPAEHQIRMSNVYQLALLLEQAGTQPEIFHYPDNREHLLTHLEERLSESDLIVLSGGVSKGKLDFVPGVLEELGVEKLFHGVAQRPGKPLWAGRREQTIAFGLPGNPVSSVSCLLHYVLPFIRHQLGLPRKRPVFAELRQEVAFKPDLTLFQLVSLRSDPATGKLYALPIRNQGSGDATSLLRSDGFIELPRGVSCYPAGSFYQVRYY